MCPGLGFKVSALNRVCPSVRPSNMLLTRRLSEVWLDGRAEGRWGLSLTHKHKWGDEFSLTHTLKSGGEFSFTHTLKWGGEFSLTHALKLGGDFSLTLSNEKVSSQSLTLPRSFTCVNGSTYSSLYIISLVCPVVVVLSIHPSRHPSCHPSIQVPHPGRRRWWKRRRTTTNGGSSSLSKCLCDPIL